MPPRFRDWRLFAGRLAKRGLSLSNDDRTAWECGRKRGQASAGWRTNDRENGARAHQKRASPLSLATSLRNDYGAADATARSPMIARPFARAH